MLRDERQGINARFGGDAGIRVDSLCSLMFRVLSLYKISVVHFLPF